MSDNINAHSRVSKSNSSSSTLGSGGVFTGLAEEVDEFGSATVFCYSDVASASGGLSIEFSTDGTNWDWKKEVSAGAGGNGTVESLAIIAKYFRVVYTNGSSAQSEFRLQTRFHAHQSKHLTANTGGEIAGEVVIPDLKKTQYGALETTERTNIIEIRSNLDVVSNIRNIVSTSGSATISASGGEISLATTAASGDSATIDSAERSRYMPGYTGQFGIGVRYGDTPTSDMKARWGAWDGSNGFYFGRDATGVFIATLKGGAEEKVYQSSWNVDRMDGSGSSGVALDLSVGNIFHINYSWYGYGVVEFTVITQGPSGLQSEYTVHRSRLSGLTVEEPNLPIRASIENGTTASAQTLYVGGRQFSIVGQYNPVRRITSENRLSLSGVSTTVVPIIGFRRKSAYLSTSVKISGFDVITNQDLLVEVRTSPTSVTGASFGTPTNHTAAECAVESDVAATAISGGEVLWSGLIDATNGGGSSRTGFDKREVLPVDLIGTDELYLCARKASASDATVSAVFRVSEEW